MATYDEKLNIHLIEEGDMLYLDGVSIEANADGTDIDEETAWFNDADIYWVDPHNGESYPVYWLMGWDADERDVEKDDERYGCMFVEK